MCLAIMSLGMWYHHRDSDGLQWGPFTPGQLTKLLNLGVLDAVTSPFECE